MPLAAGSAHTGWWVNHRKGYVRGATLTTSTENATLLVAIIVMLVNWAAVACWELLCFIVHQTRSTSRARDGLFHQQQVLLRNRIPALGIVFRMMGVALAWRTNTRGSFLRSLPLICLGVCNIALFAAGGAFVSRLTSPNGEVLARGKCGFIKGSLRDTNWQGSDTEILSNNVLFHAAYTSFREESNYARSCYGATVDRSTSFCSIYNDPFIPSIRSDNASCPFADKACLDGAVSFDTGLVSSEALGINSRTSDQIQVRKKMTCALVAIENYTEGWTSEKKPGFDELYTFVPTEDSYKYYNLGSQLTNGGPDINFTIVLSNSSLTTQEQPYKLFDRSYNPGSFNNSDFVPIQDLNQTDADLTLIFLQKRLIYTKPVEDAWFRATTKGNVSGLADVYFPDEPFTAIGCTEQYQFCNGEDNCGPLGGMSDLSLGPPAIGYNKLQNATYGLVKSYITFMQLGIILQFLRNEVLLANMNLYGGLSISSDLEPNQWKTEMANLHNISLAGWQSHGVIHAAPGNSEIKPGIFLHDFIDEETTEEHLELCKNQKFRSIRYSSISLLGLLIVILVSFMIIFLNAIVPTVVGWMQSVWKSKGSASKRAWIEDDVLQLQRAALEAKGLGPWKGRIDSVPVLDSYAEEFQTTNFEGGYAVERVQLNDVHAPLNWDNKNPAVGYNQREM